MREIKISVVIPCYNVDVYIAEALESVIAQSKQPVEIICVDDCSTDRTVSIIQSFQKNYPGLIHLVVNAVNKGATYSRNRGLAIATGNYIQFLDADDLLFPNKFEHQSHLLSQENCPDLLVSSFTKKFLDGSEKVYINHKVDQWEAIIDNKIGVTTSNLFKKSKLDEAGGWDETLRSSQEYDLMFRMLQLGAAVLFDTELVSINRERPSGSITKSNPAEKWKRYIELRIRIYEYLRDTKQLTEGLEGIFIINCLNAIRTLYIYDKSTSLEYYNKYLKGKSLPEANPNINSNYKFLYNTFGFEVAQKIVLFLKGEKVKET